MKIGVWANGFDEYELSRKHSTAGGCLWQVYFRFLVALVALKESTSLLSLIAIKVCENSLVTATFMKLVTKSLSVPLRP